jgi:hypothetical protein
MNAHDRKEFFYGPSFMFFPGFILLIGTILVLVGLSVGHIRVNGTEISKTEKYITLWVGLVIAFFGLRSLSKYLAGRPAIVVDSEGLFYRRHGVIIPWTDIRLVESNLQGENNYMFVYRRSGPPVIIYMQSLPGPVTRRSCRRGRATVTRKDNRRGLTRSRVAIHGYGFR